MEPRAPLHDLNWPAFAAGFVLVGGACAVAMPDPARLSASLVLLAGLLYLALYDIRHLRLPNAVTLPLVAAGLLDAFLNHYDKIFQDRAIGALAGYLVLWVIGLVYYKYRGRIGLGLGDAKLVAAAGAWLGWQNLPLLMLIAASGQLLVLLAMRLSGRHYDSATAMPFGPALTLAFWLLWLAV